MSRFFMVHCIVFYLWKVLASIIIHRIRKQ